LYQQAAERYEKLAAQFPDLNNTDLYRARTYSKLGSLLAHLGRTQEALAANDKSLLFYRRAAGRYEKLVAQFPDRPQIHANLVASYSELAWLLATSPDPKFRDPKRAVELAKMAVELAPKEERFWNTLGIARYRAGEWKDGIDALKKSDELLTGEASAFNAFFLAMAHWQLGEKEEARKWFDQAVAWIEKNKPEDEELKRFREEAAELLGVKEKKE
jgi:tetratricopeptide (TPR) repeat protein